MSRQLRIAERLKKHLTLNESNLIILSSILNRAGGEDYDIEDIIELITSIKEESFTRGQENLLSL